MSGDREVRLMFNKLNRLMDRTDELNEEVNEDWQKEFPEDFVSKTLQELLKNIERFQKKYKVKKNLRIEKNSFFEIVNVKFKMEEEKTTNLYEPAPFIKLIASKLNITDLETEERTVIKSYGKFIEDPRSDFDDLHKNIYEIYHSYFKKYSYSELDVGEMNLGYFFKTKFLRNWKSTVLAIIVGLCVIFIISALTGWFATLFQ